MNQTRKNQVLEVLEYWKTIEFLGQIDIPEESPDNRKLIEKIKAGKKTTEAKVTLFSDLSSPSVQIADQVKRDEEKYPDFPSVGEELSFCIGRLERNTIVEYLEKFLVNPENSPELAYSKKSAIAWFAFKTDLEGTYLQGSLQLSPLLWAISVWERCRADQKHDFYLDTEEYDGIIEKLDTALQDQNVSQFLAPVYSAVYNQYIKNLFPDTDIKKMGFCVYSRYRSEEEREKDENPTDYADLGKSFFLKDIVLLKSMVAAGDFGENTDYEKKVIDYIMSAYDKSQGMGNLPRTIISPKESQESMKRFFEQALYVGQAPMGKWPAKFMPALMQQVAVNLAIAEEDNTPVFSVNGPPGTGKTTLLKEIVASNIVKRAKLLSDVGNDPDKAFEKHSFSQGPLENHGNAYFQFAPNYYTLKTDAINDYGMLVTSCNNAAVENITIDLPKGGDILDSLEASEDDDTSVRKGLEEIHDLFDLEKSDDIETITLYGKSRQEKDIYFTRYANKLLGTDDCWGLVSAPFGKKSNIRKYCNAVLKPFVEEYKSNDTRELHRKKYAKQREIFLRQYALVEEMKAELERLCKEGRAIPIDLQNQSPELLSGQIYSLEMKKQETEGKIKTEQNEVMHLEETRPAGLFGMLQKTSMRDELITEHREKIESLKKEKASIDNQIRNINQLASYQNLIKKYSEGENKMTPIDLDFMEKYASLDEKISTKAQVTNPWFTARYNREREKLFLYACKLHKEFAASSKSLRHNVINLMIAWNLFDDCGEKMKPADREAAMPALLQTIFLMTPVISTTFASAQTFLSDISQSGVLGTLIVDESGQAQPQMSLGAMFRCRKAVIVGDPKQIEPVVTAETDMIKQLMTSKLLSNYKDKKNSVQGFADYINPYGTFLGEEEEQEWVGCPLVVHRRCIDPMYTISNVLSYDGTMKQQTGAPKPARCKTFILDKSCWINVTGSENSGAKDHFVRAQGEIVLKLLKEKFKKDQGEIPKLFIITPFTSVKTGMVEMIRKSAFYKEEPRVKKWLETNNVGTVHTFQGQGTDEVIFLLGCDKNSTGAANWVNKNIVNVAATRAKFRFYMIGDKNVWMCKPVRVARECTAEEISASELNALLSDAAEETESAAGESSSAAKGPDSAAGKSSPAAKRPDSATSKSSPAAKRPDSPAGESSFSIKGSDSVARKSFPAAKRPDPATGKSFPAAKKPDPAAKGSGQPQMTQMQKEKEATPPSVCPKCGKPLTERTGKFGKFMGCSGFPKCKYTRSLK